MTDMEPSFIYYWKGNKFHRDKRVFTSEEQVTGWYKHNRWRVDGISIVIPIKAGGQQTLT